MMFFIAIPMIGFIAGLIMFILQKVSDVSNSNPFRALIEYYKLKNHLNELVEEQKNSIARLHSRENELERQLKSLREETIASEFTRKQYFKLIREWESLEDGESIQISKEARKKLFFWAKAMAKNDAFLKKVSGLLSTSEDYLSPLLVSQMQIDLKYAFHDSPAQAYVLQAYGTRVTAHAHPIQAALELYMLYGSFNAFVINRAKSQD